MMLMIVVIARIVLAAVVVAILIGGYFGMHPPCQFEGCKGRCHDGYDGYRCGRCHREQDW